MSELPLDSDLVPRRPWWQVVGMALAVPASFVVVTWSNAQIDLLWLVRPLALTVIGALVVTAVLGVLLRDPDRVIIAAAALGAGLVVDSLLVVGLMGLLAALIVAEGLVNRARPWRFARPLTRIWSAFSVGLVLVSIATMVGNGSLAAAVAALRLDLAREAPADTWDSDARDVWVILLDGYPGDAAATAVAPKWDRSAFPSALTERGFDVVDDPRTNYLLTRLILPSMFANQHVPQLLSAHAGATLATKSRMLREALEAGVVLTELGAAGYDRIAISSGWAEVGPRRVDRVIDPPQLTELEVTLLRASGLGEILGVIAPNTHADQIRDRIATTFAAAARLADETHERPRFAFVHVPAPHPPAVIDADGSPIDGTPSASISRANDPPLDRDERIRRQFGEVDFVSDRTLELVDHILSRSVRTPVILIFSDHGTDIDWDPNQPLAAGLDERTSNFVALLSPDRPRLLPDGTTLVNVLPVILREYSGLDLETRPNTIWSWRAGADILDLVEIDPGTWTPR